MSFFIRNKGNQKGPAKGIKRKKKPQKPSNNIAPPSKDEDITSSEDEDINSNNNEDYESEDDNETAQEKKLRLAKVYLKEIEAQERRKRENEELEQEEQDEHDKKVKLRLFQDHLKQTGKFRSKVADTCKSYGEITILKGKEHKGSVTCICVSQDGEFAYSGSKNGGIIKWSLIKKQKVASLPYVKKPKKVIQGHSAPILCMALSYDNQFLAVGDTTPNIQIWNPENFTHIKTLYSHKNSINGLAFRRGTHTLYSASADRSVKVWSLDELAYAETLYGHMDSVIAIDALNRERAITAGGRDASIRMWKIPEDSQLIYNGDAGSIDAIKLLNEETFISGGDSGQISVWGVNKKKPICVVKDAHGVDEASGEALWVSALAVLVNTDLVASGSCDGNVKLWKVGDGSKTLTPLLSVPVQGFVNSLAFTSDGSALVAAVGTEHRLGRWKIIKEAKNSLVVIQLIQK